MRGGATDHLPSLEAEDLPPPDAEGELLFPDELVCEDGAPEAGDPERLLDLEDLAREVEVEEKRPAPPSVDLLDLQNHHHHLFAAGGEKHTVDNSYNLDQILQKKNATTVGRTAAGRGRWGVRPNSNADVHFDVRFHNHQNGPNNGMMSKYETKCYQMISAILAFLLFVMMVKQAFNSLFARYLVPAAEARKIGVSAPAPNITEHPLAPDPEEHEQFVTEQYGDWLTTIAKGVQGMTTLFDAARLFKR